MLGVKPKFTEYKGDSPVAYIIAANLARRHLTKEQKIALGVEIEPHFAKEAKKRMQIRKGKQPGASVENVPHLDKARDQAAKAELCIGGWLVFFLRFVFGTARFLYLFLYPSAFILRHILQQLAELDFGGSMLVPPMNSFAVMELLSLS
jgi:hypothetical protein